MGGLMQLAAYGHQDVYLTGNPQTTFWKKTYKQHTNFAVESIVNESQNGIEDIVSPSPSYGNKQIKYTVSRNGDLAYRTYLMVKIPNIQTPPAVEDYFGEQLIEYVDFEIQGQRIDRQYGEWMHIWNQLTLSNEKKESYYQMIGHRTELNNKTLYIPFQFWFCRNPGLAIPLIALQYHEVSFNIVLNNEMVLKLPPNTLYSLLIDYVLLDTRERQIIANCNHQYLIEQVQYQSIYSLEQNSSTSLYYNHPCKELVWIVNRFSDQKFNYTDKKDTFNDDIEKIRTNNPDIYNLLNSGLTFNTHNWGENPVVTAKLLLNGFERFEERQGSYFDLVQPYQHHSGKPHTGINVYSFALHPEEDQPSGTCNFSRIDSAYLELSVLSHPDNKLSVYATNYNVLRVKSGMGGLAYSN